MTSMSSFPDTLSNLLFPTKARAEIQALNQTLQTLEEKAKADRVKAEAVNSVLMPLRKTVETMFPNDPCVYDGEWSWAEQRIDIVYPELLLYDLKMNKWVAVGLAIHCFWEEEADNAQKLVLAASRYQVPLLLMRPGPGLDTLELTRRIEKVFDNKLSVPTVKAPV